MVDRPDCVPVMLQAVLRRGGAVTKAEIARNIIQRDVLQCAAVQKTSYRSPTWTTIERDDVFENIESLSSRDPVPSNLRYDIPNRAGEPCELYGVSHDQVPLHFDHFLPRAKGGDDAPSNLQVYAKT
tara:strand:- start:3320 stop:3700 length:381 start_codon:yes stop_codon:yes gene_type:complete